MAPHTRYRFSEFVISPRRRLVLRRGQALPLIPRYFDLLVLLIERRPAVVTRREIFDLVWGDVIVSDGALSQAIRTLRRTLGDDSREPTFIRTVSRHGYSFVFTEVHEDDDDAARPAAIGEAPDPEVLPELGAPPPPAEDQLIELARRLLARTNGETPLEDRRDLAQQLHVLDTQRAVEYLVGQPAHAEALALMRDTRWDVPGAGPVPLLTQPEGWTAAWLLTRLRAREALRVTKRRWAQAAGGAAGAGALAGALGGLLLVAAPTSRTPADRGGRPGCAGCARRLYRRRRRRRRHRLRRSAVPLATRTRHRRGGRDRGIADWRRRPGGRDLDARRPVRLHVRVGGAVEGLCLGAAIGAGYAATTRRRGGGIARPTGAERWRVAAVMAVCGAVTAMALSAFGSPMVGGLIHAVAQASAGSQVQLTPLGNWLGEPSFGPLTQRLVAAFEGGLFGFGLAWGLTRRVGWPANSGPVS